MNESREADISAHCLPTPLSTPLFHLALIILRKISWTTRWTEKRKKSSFSCVFGRSKMHETFRVRTTFLREGDGIFVLDREAIRTAALARASRSGGGVGKFLSCKEFIATGREARRLARSIRLFNSTVLLRN